MKMDYEKNYDVVDGFGNSISMGIQGLAEAKRIADAHAPAEVYETGTTYDHERDVPAEPVYVSEVDADQDGE